MKAFAKESNFNLKDAFIEETQILHKAKNTNKRETFHFLLRHTPNLPDKTNKFQTFSEKPKLLIEKYKKIITNISLFFQLSAPKAICTECFCLFQRFLNTSAKQQFFMITSKSVLFYHKMQKQNLNSFKTGSQLPNFISKLYRILQESENENSIKWIENGAGFEIINEVSLKCSILPQNYRHSNVSSFIRQLNMYGFRKVREGERQFYMHQYFRRDKPELSSNITRRPEKKIITFQDSSKNIIKRSEEQLKIIQEFEQEPTLPKSNIFDKYFPSKVTHESCSSIKPSLLQICKSQSLANLIGKSQAIIFESNDLKEDEENLSICQHLEFQSKQEYL